LKAGVIATTKREA